MSYDPGTLPAGLPVPQDDGAAEHLPGLELPDTPLPSTAGVEQSLAGAGELVVAYFFPRLGSPAEGGPPPGWNEIPGARGCTPQSCAFRDHDAELRGLGARVLGIAAQPLDELRERVERLELPFPLLSDLELRLKAVLRLPTFTFDGSELYRRLTIIGRGGAIERVLLSGLPARPECGRRRRLSERRGALAALADWATISSLATAGGTLVLAGATFAAVRSGNHSARVAERALLAGLRPVLMPSRLEDPPQKIHFADGHWVVAEGGAGVAEVTDDAVYLAIALRNVGSGIAVLHGWRFYPEQRLSSDGGHAPLEEFERLTRDLYVPVADVGFWQGTFRDPAASEFVAARRAIEAHEGVTVELLYGDHEGGQRTISRFVLVPREDGRWIAAVGRHWNIDRPDPR